MRIRLRALAGIFLRIGNTTFGGGDPTIAALERELVERRRVVTAEEYGVTYALCRVTPGTNMLAFCAGIGWLLRGWPGAALAVAAVTIPSAILAVVIVSAFEALMTHPGPASAISAMVAAAVGLMFAGAWLLARPHLRGRTWLRTAVIGLAAFACVWKNVLSPFQALAAAAVIGFFWPEEPDPAR